MDKQTINLVKSIKAASSNTELIILIKELLERIDKLEEQLQLVQTQAKAQEKTKNI